MSLYTARIQSNNTLKNRMRATAAFLFITRGRKSQETYLKVKKNNKML